MGARRRRTKRVLQHFAQICHSPLDARARNRAGNSRKSIFSLGPLPFFASAARTDSDLLIPR